ncbi:MAG: DNA primase [Bacteriovoracaceae bacterium]|nr:DNA primase [Bacteriovoracaceae bacterium]
MTLKERIKESLISSIISQYISLTRKGNMYVGLCPFHNDSKPSLMVNDTKGMFMCFPCNIGGDAITFVEKYTGAHFVEAIKDIGGKMGFPLDELRPKKSEESQEVVMAHKVLSKASQIYTKIVNSTNPPQAFNDFTKTRKLTPETVQLFSLGYAPGSNVIANYLSSLANKKDKNFALQVAKKIHVIREDTRGQTESGYFDTFRDRVMFPIKDHYGQTVGFGGRAVFDYQKDKGKYVNSQESFCFDKKSILYGLHLTKPHIRQKDFVILVEGYMDLIALYQNGFQNSVAIMGVALSDGAIATLKSLTKNFYLALDSDAAGIKAMERINNTLMAMDIIPKCINFAPHKDPDEYVAAKGQLALVELVDNAKVFLDFLIDRAIPKETPKVFDRKLDKLYEVFELVSPLQEKLSAIERIIQAAKRLGLKSDSAQISDSYKEFLNKKAPIKRWPKDTEPKTVDTVRSSLMISEANNNVVDQNSEELIVSKFHLSSSEKIIIQELVKHPDCLAEKEFDELLDFVHNVGVRRYLCKLRKYFFEYDGEHTSLIRDVLNLEDFPVEIKEVAAAAVYSYKGLKLDQKVKCRLLFDLKRSLEVERVKIKRNTLRKQQRECTCQDQELAIIQDLILADRELKQLTNNIMNR